MVIVSVSVGSYIGSLGSIPKGADGLLVVFLPFLVYGGRVKKRNT